MDEVLNLKPWVGKMKTSQTTGGFTVFSPFFLIHFVDVIECSYIHIFYFFNAMDSYFLKGIQQT